MDRGLSNLFVHKKWPEESIDPATRIRMLVKLNDHCSSYWKLTFVETRRASVFDLRVMGIKTRLLARAKGASNDERWKRLLLRRFNTETAINMTLQG
jgi:hypothetical protein